VACVGHAALDHVFQVPAMPVEPTKTLASAYQARPGGMSLHAAIACARLGATARLLGRVGEDAAASFLKQRLQVEGVQTHGLEAVPGTTTSLAAVIVDSAGARQIYIHRGDALRRAHALDTRQLEGADVVMADTRWPEGAQAALAWARQRGVPSLLDGDVAAPGVLERLVPLARWVAFSEPGCDQWAPGGDRDAGLRAARSRGCEIALVTLGPQGARWIGADGSAQQVGAPAVQARDTTAAGDVFHAALAVALGEGCAVGPAVAWACAAAAYKCEQGGGAEFAPSRAQLSRWLARRERSASRTPGMPAAG
jgi:sulfofructose kinase